AYLLACGYNLKTSTESQNFANEFDNVWFSVGIHPHEASVFSGNIEDYTAFLDNPKCVAIGEVGLDYYYMNSEKETQKKVFQVFLDLAFRKNKPAIIHCRAEQENDSAFQDCYEILAKSADLGGKFLLHSYTGTPEWTKKFLALGAYFGVSGMITFPKANNIRETFKNIPLDRIVLETDAPYLAPVPYRGKKNRSSYLPKIAEALANTLSKKLEEV
ncbi:MAG: TatD family hydrolase, partial [Candidatus Nanoarchaeia archaeon]